MCARASTPACVVLIWSRGSAVEIKQKFIYTSNSPREQPEENNISQTPCAILYEFIFNNWSERQISDENQQPCSYSPSPSWCGVWKVRGSDGIRRVWWFLIHTSPDRCARLSLCVCVRACEWRQVSSNCRSLQQEHVRGKTETASTRNTVESERKDGAVFTHEKTRPCALELVDPMVVNLSEM